MENKDLNKLFDFSSQTIVVTGGAKGIGFGIAQRFIEAGGNVVISDIDESGETKAKQLGNKAAFIKTDVTSETEVKNLIKQTLDKFGSLDVFINNAGIFPSVPVLEMDLELWEKIQAVNLRGVFLCSREAGQVMAKNKTGGIMVNIASIDALHPSQTGLAAYDASKHGVWGFTKNFALEVADKNIRVNAIAPGGIITEGVEAMTQGAIKVGDTKGKAIEQFASRIPMKRMGVPDDIATVALFLASDASRYMTGSLVTVDGGYLLT